MAPSTRETKANFASPDCLVKAERALRELSSSLQKLHHHPAENGSNSNDHNNNSNSNSNSGNSHDTHDSDAGTHSHHLDEEAWLHLSDAARRTRALRTELKRLRPSARATPAQISSLVSNIDLALDRFRVAEEHRRSRSSSGEDEKIVDSSNANRGGVTRTSSPSTGRPEPCHSGDAGVKVFVEQLLDRSENSLSAEFICKICQIAVVGCSPKLTKCSHLFCGDCLSKWFQVHADSLSWASRAKGGGTAPCPVCKEPLRRGAADDVFDVSTDGPADSAALAMLLAETAIVCANAPSCREDGRCNWQGTLGEYQAHIQLCTNEPLALEDYEVPDLVLTGEGMEELGFAEESGEQQEGQQEEILAEPEARDQGDQEKEEGEEEEEEEEEAEAPANSAREAGLEDPPKDGQLLGREEQEQQEQQEQQEEDEFFSDPDEDEDDDDEEQEFGDELPQPQGEEDSSDPTLAAPDSLPLPWSLVSQGLPLDTEARPLPSIGLNGDAQEWIPPPDSATNPISTSGSGSGSPSRPLGFFFPAQTALPPTAPGFSLGQLASQPDGQPAAGKAAGKGKGEKKKKGEGKGANRKAKEQASKGAGHSGGQADPKVQPDAQELLAAHRAQQVTDMMQMRLYQAQAMQVQAAYMQQMRMAYAQQLMQQQQKQQQPQKQQKQSKQKKQKQPQQQQQPVPAGATWNAGQNQRGRGPAQQSAAQFPGQQFQFQFQNPKHLSQAQAQAQAQAQQHHYQSGMASGPAGYGYGCGYGQGQGYHC